MNSDFREKHRQELVWWVENHHLDPEVFVTFSWKGTNEGKFFSMMTSMLIKTSKYSKSHIAALGGYEKSSDHIHGHLVILGENRLKKGFLKERWDHGKCHERFFDSSCKESVRNACFYGLNHPEIVMFADFCPRPKTCSVPGCSKQLNIPKVHNH